jgi:hypothetical protein
VRDELVAHLRRQPAGALRLMKAYAIDHAAGALPDPGDAAVTRLDAWLTAGKPEQVDGPLTQDELPA